MLKFNKDSLKTGDWLTLRNGSEYQFLEGNVMVSHKHDGWHNLGDYNYDLLDKCGYRSLDIVKVVRPAQAWHYCYGHRDKGDVVFNRLNTVKMTIVEIHNKLNELGCNIDTLEIVDETKLEPNILIYGKPVFQFENIRR